MPKNLKGLTFVITTLLAVGVFVATLSTVTPKKTSTSLASLSNQIMVDPDNPAWLVYNRDTNGDGKKDPYFLAAPGDPEGFLYKSSSERTAILNQMQGTGLNGMYLIAVRKWGTAGDGGTNEHPFISSTNPTLDMNKINAWKASGGSLEQLNSKGYTIFFFLYDDAVCVFSPCKSAPTVPVAEETFIKDLVNALEGYPNLIWVIAEEYQEAFGTGSQRISNIAAKIKQYDDYDHPVAIHQATGDNSMDYPNDSNIDQFAHQASPISVSDMHDDVESAVKDANGRFNVNMSEAHPYHQDLLKSGDRTNLRKSNWAAAMAGSYVMVLGTWSVATPTSDMLKDWGRIRTFMESTNFNEMTTHDELAASSTQYVLANPGNSYIAYTSAYSGGMGLTGMTSGNYNFKWMDTVSGTTITQNNVPVGSGTQTWTKPSGFGNEIVVHIRKISGPTGTPVISTPTPTPTRTSTPTPTRTPTPTPTRTPTPTPTRTPTPTPTRTLTPTPTRIPTVTVVPTNTPTLRPTNTPTTVSKQGDANGDGRVDLLDYVVWLGNYGRTGAIGPRDGDFNSDSRVDLLDYVIWLNNFGK